MTPAKTILFVAGTIIAVLLLLAGGLFVGSFEITGDTIRDILTAYDPDNPIHFAVVNLRLPRICAALTVGASLAAAGYLMQVLVNNPLADPFLLGTASGAALGANAVFFGLVPMVAVGIYMPPVFAFIGALAVTAAAMIIALRKGIIQPSMLLLAGVALSSLMTAVIGLGAYFSDSEGKLRTIVFWIMGSFERTKWTDIPLPLAALVIVIILFLFLHKQLTVLLFGEERASDLGVNVGRLRVVILISAASITAFAVAISGSIGFVGLMIPHFVRGIFGISGRFNLLFAALIGGIFLAACDLASRLIYPPSGLPIGMVTAFLGVPFFVYLLAKNKFRFN